MRRSFWKKVEDGKTKGITADQFERIENLEAAIAYHQNQIDEYEREIKQIENKAKALKQIEEENMIRKQFLSY